MDVLKSRDKEAALKRYSSSHVNMICYLLAPMAQPDEGICFPKLCFQDAGRT